LDVHSISQADTAKTVHRLAQIADDSFWKDPPGIFEKVVWPAYVEAHAKHFIAGDVEHSALSPEQEQGEGAAIVLLDDDGALSMDEMLERSCGAIFEAVRARTCTPDQT
jgi:nicotinamide/nicotinate riboside kinase